MKVKQLPELNVRTGPKCRCACHFSEDPQARCRKKPRCCDNPGSPDNPNVAQTRTQTDVKVGRTGQATKRGGK